MEPVHYNKHVINIPFKNDDVSTHFDEQAYYNRQEFNSKNANYFVLTNGANKNFSSVGAGTTGAIATLGKTYAKNADYLFCKEKAKVIYSYNPKDVVSFQLKDKYKEALESLKGNFNGTPVYPGYTVYCKEETGQIRVDPGNNKSLKYVTGVYHIYGLNMRDLRVDVGNRDEFEKIMSGLAYNYTTKILEHFDNKDVYGNVIHISQIPGENFKGTDITKIAIDTAINKFEPKNKDMMIVKGYNSNGASFNKMVFDTRILGFFEKLSKVQELTSYHEGFVKIPDFPSSPKDLSKPSISVIVDKENVDKISDFIWCVKSCHENKTDCGEFRWDDKKGIKGNVTAISHKLDIGVISPTLIDKITESIEDKEKATTISKTKVKGSSESSNYLIYFILIIIIILLIFVLIYLVISTSKTNTDTFSTKNTKDWHY
jgi:hypothetical protein